MPSKYAHLFKDEDIKRWFENLNARSDLTATIYLRSLGLYCHINKTTPKAILKDANTKEFRDKFTDFVRRLENEGKAGSYIARFKKVLHSWLSYNGLNVKLKVNIKGEYDTPTIDDERIPSKEELEKIIRMATPRARVSISLMAFSGLRPESLGNYSGSDGIKLDDLIESKMLDKTIEFTDKPEILAVRKGLSKTRHKYFTFIPEQGLIYIKDYVEERMKRGENLNPDLPLLGLDPRGIKKNPFLRTTLVTRDIKEAITKAGFTWRPYVLRAYFNTNMIIAESNGKISHPYLQFLMGHKGDIEARYSTNKGVLLPDMIKDMREVYKRCQDHLQTIKSEAGEDQIKQAFKKQLLAVAGFNEEEIEAMSIAEIGDEEIRAKIREKLLGMMKNNGSRQRVVPVEEVESYITQGWEYVNTLPNDKAILKLPI